jgi:hypothetical protein
MKNLNDTINKTMESMVEMRNSKAQYEAHNKAHEQYLERDMFKEAKELEKTINIHSGEYIGWKTMLRFQLTVALTQIENLN